MIFKRTSGYANSFPTAICRLFLRFEPVFYNNFWPAACIALCQLTHSLTTHPLTTHSLIIGGPLHCFSKTAFVVIAAKARLASSAQKIPRVTFAQSAFLARSLIET